MQFIDLHTHSQASDGTDSPGQLVRNAQIQGLAAVAVTDHDTVSGLDEAEAAARDLGLEFVRGCELSTSTELGEMHVLGLWLPRDLAPLQDRLQYLRRKRSERNVSIVEKLQGLGVEIELDEVLHEARGESVGRPHIAAVLVRKGYVKDVSEAFKEYLGYYGRAYLPKEVLQPEEAVEVLSSLGATVCLPNGAPLCDECPAADFCLAKAQGVTQDLPTRPAKKPRRIEERVVFLLFHAGKVALRRRPGKGLLAGLWEYPNEPAPAEEALAQWGLADQLAGEPEFAGTGKHIFTHVEWRMTAQRAELRSPALPEGWVWADRAALEHTYALPSALAPFRSAAEEGLP